MPLVIVAYKLRQGKQWTSEMVFSSVRIDISKGHYLIVFDLPSMEDATKSWFYPELVGEPLRLTLNFSFPLRHVTELTVLGERKSLISSDMFGVVWKNI